MPSPFALGNGVDNGDLLHGNFFLKRGFVESVVLATDDHISVAAGETVTVLRGIIKCSCDTFIALDVIE